MNKFRGDPGVATFSDFGTAVWNSPDRNTRLTLRFRYDEHYEYDRYRLVLGMVNYQQCSFIARIHTQQTDQEIAAMANRFRPMWMQVRAEGFVVKHGAGDPYQPLTGRVFEVEPPA